MHTKLGYKLKLFLTDVTGCFSCVCALIVPCKTKQGYNLITRYVCRHAHICKAG